MERQLRRHNETVLGTLEEGDLVEFPRELYSHWGVYVGMYQCLLFNCRISIFLAFFSHFIRAQLPDNGQNVKRRT